MGAEQPAVDVAKIEELISQVRGVLAVRVVPDAHGQIDELHVVGSPGRSAKQMVRDVESLLYVRGGVRLDHRKISLVQIADTQIQPAMLRVLLLDISQSQIDNLPAVVVILGMSDRHVQGMGQARAEHLETLEQLAGYATIHALDQLIGPRGQFRLEYMQRQRLGNLDVCLAHLSLTTDDGIETLLGISIVRDDTLTPVVRAILDAANRRLQRLLGGERGSLY